jgi:hypothetical protein
MRMIDILPSHVREWVVRPADREVGAPTTKQCKVILNAVLTTAFNDQITVLHAGKGVATPAAAKKQKVIVKLIAWIELKNLRKDDLLFPFEQPTEPRRMIRPDELPDPATLGHTEPNANGRTYLRGTKTAYTAAKCRCQHCRNAMSAYRAERRAGGKDAPRPLRGVNTDRHIPRDWFRRNIWNPAIERSGIELHVTPHGLRHAHASWLLAGGADIQADIQVVKDRLCHGSIITTQNYMHTLARRRRKRAEGDGRHPRHTHHNACAGRGDAHRAAIRGVIMAVFHRRHMTSARICAPFSAAARSPAP